IDILGDTPLRMPLHGEHAFAARRPNAFNDAVSARGLDHELPAHSVDALKMRRDDRDRRCAQGAFQYAARGEVDTMLKSEHLVQRQAWRRMVDLLAVGLAEIGPERCAVRHGDLLKSPADAQDRPILLYRFIDQAQRGRVTRGIERAGPGFAAAVPLRRDIEGAASQEDAIQTADDRPDVE